MDRKLDSNWLHGCWPEAGSDKHISIWCHGCWREAGIDKRIPNWLHGCWPEPRSSHCIEFTRMQLHVGWGIRLCMGDDGPHESDS